jgi:2-C-methyl-D-erythritol 4-phosphate cytidylyltransferase
MGLSERAKTIAIIPAAGAGVRMGAHRAKQFLEISGKPILAMTLGAFQRSPAVDDIILVVPSEDLEYCRTQIVERFSLDKVKKVVRGGKRRQDSVRLGLEAARGNCELVVIHDGVRPVIDDAFIGRVVAAGRRHGAVITAMPAKETVKEVNDRKQVVKTHDRGRIWLVQTPQVFKYEEILKAHHRALEEGWEEVTDDSRLVERLDIPVHVLEGSEENIKVTTPHDLELARFFLGKKEAPV